MLQKTCIAQIIGATIPPLELMDAFTLAELTSCVKNVLSDNGKIFIDSEVENFVNCKNTLSSKRLMKRQTCF